MPTKVIRLTIEAVVHEEPEELNKRIAEFLQTTERSGPLYAEIDYKDNFCRAAKGCRRWLKSLKHS